MLYVAWIHLSHCIWRYDNSQKDMDTIWVLDIDTILVWDHIRSIGVT